MRAAELGLPVGYGSLAELLADEAVQVVHVTSPIALHHALTKGILAAGRHMVCEKPLALTSAELAELVELAAASGLVHAVNFNLRFYPLNQHVAGFVADGGLGELRPRRQRGRPMLPAQLRELRRWTRDMLVGDAVLESSRTGRWVEVARCDVGTSAQPSSEPGASVTMKLGLMTAPFPDVALPDGADWAVSVGFEVLAIAYGPGHNGPAWRYAGTSQIDVANLSSAQVIELVDQLQDVPTDRAVLAVAA